MRKLIVLLTIAILAFGATPVLAITLQNTFQVTGHLGVALSAGKCAALAYPAMCPSAVQVRPNSPSCAATPKLICRG